MSYAWIVRIINYFIPVKKKTWVFSADYGRTYREGSKYLLEYMLQKHSDYECFFITRNKNVKNDLEKRGIPCLMNFSLMGIWEVSRAEAVFACQSFGDIVFAYKKKGRKFFFLGHGMPYKKAMLALSDDYKEKFFTPNRSIKDKIKNKLGKLFVNEVTVCDSAFHIATSEFLIPYVQAYYGNTMPISVIEMPRNDALYQHERFINEKWVKGIEGKFVITFMPTHRNYGKGELTPVPFKNNIEVQNWMRENNVVFLMKQHPNMIPLVKDEDSNDVIIDVTKLGIDPMTCVFKSDILITDHSSVWMDYLLMKRPLLFYRYDNFENDDGGILYDIKDDFGKFMCYSEKELFTKIKDIFYNYESNIPDEKLLRKYHKYTDGKACEHYYNEVEKFLRS